MATTKESSGAGLFYDFTAYLRLLAEPVILYHDVWPFSGFREDEFRKAVLHWREGCVDTTAFALESIHELSVERVEEYITEPKRGEVVDFLKQHFDPTSGGFRQSAGVPVSVYATHMAFSVLRFLLPQPVPSYVQPLGKRRAIEELGKDGREIVERSVHFVAEKQDPTTGGFLNTEGSLPEDVTVSVSHSACNLLWDLESLKQETKAGLRRFLLSGDEGRSVLTYFEESGVGFKEAPHDDEPLSCSTYYALRTLQLLGEKVWIDSHSSQLKEFLMKCYHEKDSSGGFRAHPSPGLNRSLSHTCLALSSLVGLLDADRLALEESGNIDLRKVRKYMHECKSTHGGFGFGRGPDVARLEWILRRLGFRGRWYSPNLHMIRNVLSVTELLKPLDPEFSQVTEDKESLLRLIDRAHLTKDGAICWAGYPVNFLGSKEELQVAGWARSAAHRLALGVRRTMIDLPLLPRAREKPRKEEFTSVPYWAAFLACLLLVCGVSALRVFAAPLGLGGLWPAYFAVQLALALSAIAAAALTQVVIWRILY